MVYDHKKKKSTTNVPDEEALSVPGPSNRSDQIASDDEDDFDFIEEDEDIADDILDLLDEYEDEVVRDVVQYEHISQFFEEAGHDYV